MRKGHLKTFVKHGKRYRVVFTSPDKGRTILARGMCLDKQKAIHYDLVKGHWLLGVR